MPYDDPAYITGNEYINQGLSADGLLWALTYRDSGRALAHEGAMNLWHPLTWISHQADVSVFGLRHVWGHHLHSVLLHAVAGCLLFSLCCYLGFSGRVAFFIAALFLVHPLRAESVAWLSARKDVLSGVFFFGALWAALGGWRRMGLVLFAAAIAAKPSVVILPVLLVLAQGWRANERDWGPRFWWDGLRREWAWFGLAGAGALVAIWFQSQGTHAPDMDALPLPERLLTMATAFLFLLFRSVFPVHLSFHYPYPEAGAVFHLLSWAFVGTVGSLLLTFRKHLHGFWVAVLWYVVCWLPMSGLVYVGTSFTHDRYAYLALVGPTAWAVAALSKLRFGWIVCAGLVLAYGTLATLQTSAWRSGESLFARAHANQPRDIVATVNLGSVYQVEGRHEEALALFEKTLARHPHHRIALFNQGNSLHALGRWPEAAKAFRGAVAVDPSFAGAWRNLGLVLTDPQNPHTDPAAARDAFLAAWEHSGERDAVALFLLIRTEFQLGHFTSGRARLPTLRALDPRDPTIRRHLEQWGE
ncbi:MAG: tetratricopeptide repeat protein [Opitutales bacterium]|nr:tetratricopeptide repeat protein [Opitutales bacterium]